MSTSWLNVDLGEVCTVIAGQSPAGATFNSRGEGLPFYQGKKDFGARYIAHPTVWTTAATKEAMAGDILMSVRAPVGPINYATQRACIGRGLAAIRPTGVEPDFLFYYLLTKQSEISGREGAVFASISRDEIRRIRIPLPPIIEQRRIVTILDEALEAISSAITLANNELSGVQELRLAILANILQSATGPTTTLAEQTDLLVGFAFKSAEYVKKANAIRLLRGDNVAPGSIRWMDAKYWPSERAFEFYRYQLQVDDVVIAMDRPWIKGGLKQAILTEADIPSLLVQRVARLRCKPAMAVGYLQHLIASPMFESHVVDHAGGSGVPHISGTQLAAFAFALPSLEEQTKIVERLDILRTCCDASAGYRMAKLAALDELKQSFLARAFSDDLTALLPALDDGAFATPEQAANILAFFQWRHERAGRGRFFGRVMGQKTLDLVERVGGVELGRRPYKDAAGPNDRPHMAAAERYAKEQGFFEFVERPGGGYDFKKLVNHPGMLKAAKAALKPIDEQLEQVAEILTGKDTLEAEVFATALAAWNNLVANGRDAQDAAILHEARDAWHPDKLAIPVAKFKDAIREIRRRDLVPDGSAKVVPHRQASLL